MCVQGGLGDGVVWTKAVKGLIPDSSVGERTWMWVCKAVQGWSAQGALEHSVRSGGGARDMDS